MKKLVLIFGMFFLCANVAFGLQIVYPKVNPAKINAPSTFFIGSVAPSETLKINGQPVNVSSIGAFAYMLPLKSGVNNFKLESGSDVTNFVIVRTNPCKQSCVLNSLIEYPQVVFTVKKDGAPLRSTPKNAGINRLSHLPSGTVLLINGEQGDFYRVVLGETFGWILKSDVEQISSDYAPAEFKGFNIESDAKNCFYKIDLTGKIPFEISEDSGLKLMLFNIKNCKNGLYTLDIPVKKLFGYECYYDGNTFVLKIRKLPVVDKNLPLKNINITVDAGHGGCENGAIGGLGHKEKDINLLIAQYLKSELVSRGAKVVMTREDDSRVSLSKRVDIAHDADSDLLLSIHSNALPDGQNPLLNRGTSVYYYHNQSKALAESVLGSMTSELKIQNDRVRQGSLALVRPTFCPSVLIEVAYIINPDDYTLLLDKNFQMNCAKAIADGIENYILKLNP